MPLRILLLLPKLVLNMQNSQRTSWGFKEITRKLNVFACIHALCFANDTVAEVEAKMHIFTLFCSHEG